MAEGSGGDVPPGVPTPPPPPPPTLKGLREQMVAAAHALAEERRNQSSVSTVSLQSPVSTKSKPVIDGSLLKSEERQRLARERREEREKQHAAKETQLLEKEKKAKLQYEKQMEEKQKKLKEQKLKEQQRRAAVEQKRKQKIEEEKERYEAVMHRTLERSQRLETRQKRWSWSGSAAEPDGKAEAPAVVEANKRSTSAVNLKQPETVLHKRLSSSAALLNSPSQGSAKRSSSLNRLNNKSSLNSEQALPNALQMEQKGKPEKKRSSSLSGTSNKLPELENVHKEDKTACRLVSPLENNSISRLLAPTQASLARSKSAAALSADGKDPAASAHFPKVPLRSRSSDRLKAAAASSESVSLESAQKPEPAKQPPSSTGRRALSPSLSRPSRSVSPGNVGKHPPSPAAIRRRPHPASPNVLLRRPPSAVTVSKPAPIQRPLLTLNVLGVAKKKTDAECKPNDAAGQEPGAAMHTLERELPAGPSKTKEESPASFTFLPELPHSIFSPSSPAASSFCSQDFPPASSVARKMFFGYDPKTCTGASPRPLSGTSNPSQADLTGRSASPGTFPPRVPHLGHPLFARGAAGGFPPNFAVEATRPGDGAGVSPLRCVSFPCSHRSGSPSMLPPPFSRRSLAQEPMMVATNPFVLNKLLHSFQIMRCSLDNISQELGVLNTRLDANCKTVPGSTTAEEAAKMLAEKRRLAREQREREDQEKLQREEEERMRQEEMARIALEQQAEEEEALRELEELKRAGEEEQQQLAEKDRTRREQEEQGKLLELQLQREEAEAKAFEEAERQRQERERIMQQNLQERLERKKRIEEIMKRTRKADQNEAKNEDKSNEEDEGVEEDEELCLEKQDQPEKSSYNDSSLEDGPEASHNLTLLPEDSEMETDNIFINGNKQELEDERNEDGTSVYFTPSVEGSIPAKGKVIENSEILHANEADRSVGFIPNLNGKSSAWNFEEIIELGLHPKTARLGSESVAADSPIQNFRDGGPTSPKLAFEEDGARNSLTKPMEAASEL